MFFNTICLRNRNVYCQMVLKILHAMSQKLQYFMRNFKVIWFYTFFKYLRAALWPMEIFQNLLWGIIFLYLCIESSLKAELFFLHSGSGSDPTSCFNSHSHHIRGLPGSLSGASQIQSQRDASGIHVWCHLSSLSEGNESLKMVFLLYVVNVDSRGDNDCPWGN